MCQLAGGTGRNRTGDIPRLLLVLFLAELLSHVCAGGDAPRRCRSFPAVNSEVNHGVGFTAGAGDGDRTRVSSLEGWCSAIELHRHIALTPAWWLTFKGCQLNDTKGTVRHVPAAAGGRNRIRTCCLPLFLWVCFRKHFPPMGAATGAAAFSFPGVRDSHHFLSPWRMMISSRVLWFRR